MNFIATIFLLLNTVALLVLPRRLAPVPLLLGACYMTLGQGIEIGPFSFTVIRLLVLAGVVRIIARGERLAGGMNSLDRVMLLWAAWALLSSFFHKDLSGAFISRLGLVYNACGIYFLLRIFCQSFNDVVGLCRVTAILLVPLAVEMLYEKLAAYNLFSVLGGVSESPTVRADRIRAQGPFAHAILAGTVGAVCLPLVIVLWNRHRIETLIGIGACLLMIFAASSSGPILSFAAALGALYMWRYRDQMRLFRWLAVLGYIGLELVMKAPAYYLIARIDLTGGSTGYHRSRLIQSAFEHLSEWWLAGTDYTRDWMVTGVAWSADHSDITNYYLRMGVMGGLPLMLLFIAVLVKAFSFVGQALRQMSESSSQSRFMIWALGAALFAHVVTFIGVSYFDQSYVFIYLALAAIGSVWSATVSVGNVHTLAAIDLEKASPATKKHIMHINLTSN